MKDDSFRRYKRMNNKSKGIGLRTCEGPDGCSPSCTSFPPFCSFTDFFCQNIQGQLSDFLFILIFVLKSVRNIWKRVHLSISEFLFFAENTFILS